MHKDFKLGLIARADKTGLGNQTRNLAKLLNPHKIMVIDSSSFNGNAQDFTFFNNYNSYVSKGFLSKDEVNRFLDGLDAVLTCELFYNNSFVDIANSKGVKTYNQFNYEFLDNLINPRLALPTKLIAPSKWKFEKVREKFGNVVYLPPPLDSKQFKKSREKNMNRKGKRRYLHIVGIQAIHDRNGTIDLLNSLKYTKSDFEIIVKVQSGFRIHGINNKLKLDYSYVENEEDLYYDFDALIMPRRFAGLCLPMNEALMSGLPVIMTDISPNNQVLPDKWLVESKHKGQFKARAMIDYYSVIHDKLGEKLDWLSGVDIYSEKQKAYQIALENYSFSSLRPKYERLFND